MNYAGAIVEPSEAYFNSLYPVLTKSFVLIPDMIDNNFNYKLDEAGNLKIVGRTGNIGMIGVENITTSGIIFGDLVINKTARKYNALGKSMSSDDDEMPELEPM